MIDRHLHDFRSRAGARFDGWFCGMNPLRLSMKTTITASLVVLLTALAYGSERNLRFVKQFQISGSAEVVVVAEGDLEPRSVGSYSLRLYGGRSDKLPTDDFIVGLVRPRHGMVEAVRFNDIDGDDEPDVVVIIRSAGSGGYVSADAFRHRKGSLELITSVSGLDKRADPVSALRDQFKASHENRRSAK